MAYRVNLTLVSGRRIPSQGIYYGRTPKPGDSFWVNIGKGARRVQVTVVHKTSSIGAAVRTIDDVEAQEL